MFQLRPRLVDWSILGTVLFAFGTGLVSLVAGRPDQRWVFVAHGIGGLILVVLLGWKFRRVHRRLRPARWTGTTVVSILTAAAAVGAVVTGIVWVSGGNVRLAAWNALNLHIVLGVALLVLVVFHLANRFRLPRRHDFEGRRTVLQYTVLIAGGVIAWRLQQAVVAALKTAGASRRFTGSRERAGAAGNAFPVTSWVADDPDPIDPDAWRLSVRGAVEREYEVSYDEIRSVTDEARATLDCTGGWYATRDWTGVRVDRLIERAQPTPDARWVSVTSVTGYRFSLPIDEARAMLLATHVDNEPLSHGHGFPIRLVAPGRRGFQWVKWITEIEVRTTPDYGQWVAIFTSSFTRG